MLQKTIKIDDDVQAVLRTSTISPMDDQFTLILPPGQLERKLYERVNKVLEVLGGKWNRFAKGHIFTKDPREAFADVMNGSNLAVARDGWFPTPPAVIEQMLDLGGIGEGHILEPSAGEGAIADAICARWPEAKDRIVCAERDISREKILMGKGYWTFGRDFLLSIPGRSYREHHAHGPIETCFDRVYMNPLFEAGQDIDHVRHAYEFLVPGGVLVSVMGEGAFFRSGGKYRAFREWYEDKVIDELHLLSGAFKMSGTQVNACVVVLRS